MSQDSVVKSEGDGRDFCPGGGVRNQDPKPLPSLLLTCVHRHFPTLLRLQSPERTMGIVMAFPGGCRGSLEWLCLLVLTGLAGA